MTTSQRLAATAIGVKSIPTAELIPNPHNPRLLFDREPLQTLKASIKKVGILVPLTVYRGSKERKWIILDGQRRWICARQLNLKSVPVNQVAEPSLVQNIVTMFQIHRLRQDWELMPTALKVEVLMKELKETNDGPLAQLLSLDRAVIVRCKKLLSYSRKYQDLMLNAEPAERVKADFFIELYAVRNDRFVNSMSWFTKEKFTQRMLHKYRRQKGLKAVTDFRKMKQHINNARHAKKDAAISKRLREFTEDDSLSLDYLLVPGADTSAQARRLVAKLLKVENDLKAMSVEDYYGEERLWEALERLFEIIESRLRAAGRRIRK